MDIFETDEIKQVLAQTTEFISTHNLKITKVYPSISGETLDLFDSEKLKNHDKIHLNLTFELANTTVIEKDSRNSNLVSSNIFQEDLKSDCAKTNINHQFEQQIETFFKEVIEKNLSKSIMKSQAKFAENDLQVTQFYDQLKNNLFHEFANELKLRKDFFEKVSQIIETSYVNVSPLQPTMAKSNFPSDEMSKIQHSAYLQLKINEIFEENKSKLLREIKEELKQVEKSNIDMDKVAFSKLLNHYDALKSKLMMNIEKYVYQSFVESQLRGNPTESQKQELIIQDFLNNLPNVRIEEIAGEEDEKIGKSEHVEVLEKSKMINISTLLQFELKAYMSRLISRNLQKSNALE